MMKHGGEIEKIIGDGIICLFGEPFLRGNKDTFFDKADKCSKEIISELKNTEKAVKIAPKQVRYLKNLKTD